MPAELNLNIMQMDMIIVFSVWIIGAIICFFILGKSWKYGLEAKIGTSIAWPALLVGYAVKPLLTFINKIFSK